MAGRIEGLRISSPKIDKRVAAGIIAPIAIALTVSACGGENESQNTPAVSGPQSTDTPTSTRQSTPFPEAADTPRVTFTAQTKSATEVPTLPIYTPTAVRKATATSEPKSTPPATETPTPQPVSSVDTPDGTVLSCETSDRAEHTLDPEDRIITIDASENNPVVMVNYEYLPDSTIRIRPANNENADFVTFNADREDGTEVVIQIKEDVEVDLSEGLWVKLCQPNEQAGDAELVSRAQDLLKGVRQADEVIEIEVLPDGSGYNERILPAGTDPYNSGHIQQEFHTFPAK